MSAFCRDCLSDTAPGTTRCKHCGSRRILAHDELAQLSIAHLDCDAFYAAIEKRDNPALRDKAVIVGGTSRRGVVSTACYVARINGVRSAMPMFKALELCPHAVVIHPNFIKYTEASRAIRTMMRELTPLVQPLSLDEAYMDLSGTERLHGRSPAKTLAALTVRIEREVGITASVGLSCNKFLAKLASDLDKPRGFAVIGAKEAKVFLRERPVSFIRGAGAALQARLAKDGITMIAQLQDADPKVLAGRYGSTGLWLYRMAQAEDHSAVDPEGETKSISAETTFESDLSAFEPMERILWALAEKVSRRAKAAELGGRTVTLKLKTKSFRIKTRSLSIDAPTQLADRIFRTAQAALKREADGTKFRLLGVGITGLTDAAGADPRSLIDTEGDKRAAAERAMDRIRGRFGGEAVSKGRGLKRRR
jgi:DNA polymerase-4